MSVEPARSVTVPDVVGMLRSQAREKLQTAGFGVSDDADPLTAATDPRVTGQSLKAGSVVNEGSLVQLYLDVPTATPTPTRAPPPPAPETVVYSVTGDGVSGASSISYVVPNGSFSQEQAVGAPLPWSKEMPISGSYNSYIVTAQGDGGGGSITCTITVRGTVVVTQTSTGSYAVVTCAH